MGAVVTAADILYKFIKLNSFKCKFEEITEFLFVNTVAVKIIGKILFENIPNFVNDDGLVITRVLLSQPKIETVISSKSASFSLNFKGVVHYGI
jgi:hypothetical protein